MYKGHCIYCKRRNCSSCGYLIIYMYISWDTASLTRPLSSWTKRRDVAFWPLPCIKGIGCCLACVESGGPQDRRDRKRFPNGWSGNAYSLGWSRVVRRLWQTQQAIGLRLAQDNNKTATPPLCPTFRTLRAKTRNSFLCGNVITPHHCQMRSDMAICKRSTEQRKENRKTARRKTWGKN